MKRYVLNIPTVIALLLIPTMAVLRVILPALSLRYGAGDITTNSVLLLIFGIYCFVVSTLNLICVNRLWKKDDSDWKRTMVLVYFYILVFAVALAFLLMFNNERYWRTQGNIAYGHSTIPLPYNDGVFSPVNFLTGLLFVSTAFLCPIGIVSFIFGVSGLRQAKNKSKSYLVITFLISVLFTLGGALPLFIVFVYWAGGGISMCYCPVNKRSFKKDVLLMPLYAYRRKQLAKRLQI